MAQLVAARATSSQMTTVTRSFPDRGVGWTVIGSQPLAQSREGDFPPSSRRCHQRGWMTVALDADCAGSDRERGILTAKCSSILGEAASMPMTPKRYAIE